jgi:prophage regulatory protein
MPELERFIRTAEVINLTGLSRTEFYRYIKEGRFPKPDLYLGERSPAWREASVARWQKEMLAGEAR